jgi:hypothetical protein
VLFCNNSWNMKSFTFLMMMTMKERLRVLQAVPPIRTKVILNRSRSTDTVGAMNRGDSSLQNGSFFRIAQMLKSPTASGHNIGAYANLKEPLPLQRRSSTATLQRRSSTATLQQRSSTARVVSHEECTKSQTAVAGACRGLPDTVL